MIEPNKLIADLETIVSSSRECTASLQLIADTIRQSGNYRWVGLYDVDHAAGIINNVVWSGPGVLPPSNVAKPHEASHSQQRMMWHSKRTQRRSRTMPER